MKRLIFTIFLIFNIYVCAFASAPIVSNATNVGTYSGYNLYYYEKGSPVINCGSFGGNIYYKTCTLYKDDYSIQTTKFYPGYITFTLNDAWFSDYKIHKFNVTGFIADDPVYVRKTTPAIDTVCSQTPHIIAFISTGSVLKLQKSSNNGISWQDIVCTTEVYTELTPIGGTYLYRIVNGDGTYSSIKQVTYQDAVPSSLIVTPATNSKTVDETITLSASATDVTYSYQWKKDGTAISGATSSIYSISVLKAINAGNYTCTVSNGCNSITSAAATLSIDKAPQVITFPDIPAKTFGDAAFTLPATTDKGLTINYQSTNTAVATINGNTVTIVSSGTANIIASQSGTADYLAATGVTKTLTVNKIAQTITFNTIPVKTYGGAAFTLPATTDKGLTITYTSTNTAVATVSGNTVTILNAGCTDIVANQTGTVNYYAAPTVSQTLTVNKAAQAITFSTIGTKTYGDASITLNQNTDKGLAITYTSNNTAVVSVQGNVLTLNNVGTATITAAQSGSSNYLPATSVTQDITIQKASQTIVWSNIPNKTYGDADFALPQTTDKGLTISYLSSDPTIASVSGNTVSIKGVGTVNITASQAGNGSYNAASNVILPLTISKAYQTITFADLPTYTYSASPITLSASNNSGLAVAYDSSDPNVASISGNTLTINNAGQCYITASSSGDVNHFSATPVQKLLKVNKADQAISFDVISDKTYGDNAFVLAGSASTSLPVTFSSSSPAKLIVSGNNATIAGAGSFVITATQAGTGNYNAISTTRTVIVNKATLIAAADNKIRLYGDANPTFSITYSGFVNGDTKYELAAVPIASTTATNLSNAGDYDITLSSITDNNYSLTYRKGTLSINQAPLSVMVQNATKEYGNVNPTFAVVYSGFKNSESSKVLTSIPVVTTTAKTMSDAGAYDLIGTGGSTQNYTLSYTNGQLTINKATLAVFASSTSCYYGDVIPTFKMNITGFKGADDLSVLDVLPTLSCIATQTSSPASYDLIYSGGSDNNYNYDLKTSIGKLQIYQASLQIFIENDTIKKGEPIPNCIFRYVGFKNGENESNLQSPPSISWNATINSPVGQYNYIMQNDTTRNYYYKPNGAILTILSSTGINDINSIDLSVYPNPATDIIHIQSDAQISKVEVYSANGQMMQLQAANDIKTVNISALTKGSYLVRLFGDFGVVAKMMIKK